MVHDVARKTVLLYGGTRGAPSDQWAWDGSRWRALTSASHAPSYQMVAMAYDSSRNVAVIFSGNHYGTPTDGATPVSMLDETWEWDGTDWSKATPPKSPGARRGHSMTYDEARRRVLLFGGRASSAGPRQDTWEYDGVTWVEREPIDFPTGRYGACMAYDPHRQLVVMFGGADFSGNFGETWHWDGTNWSRGASGPTPRRSCAMAWDSARKAIVMYGGRLSDDSTTAETWVYE